jgi:DNA-binding response OmpR family regulator
MVGDSLLEHGYAVRHVESGRDAERAIEEMHPDVIVLDLMLPDRNGLTLCAKLKDRARSPLIICSATRRKDDAVLGFQLGADDFLSKPFSIDELLARVDLALGRRSELDSGLSKHAAPTYVSGRISIDAARCEATVGGHSLKLTPTEFRLLSSVASRAPGVVSRQELAEPIWGCLDPSFIRSLDVHMRRLRAKLVAAAPGTRLVARRGFGYQLLDGTDGRFRP